MGKEAFGLDLANSCPRSSCAPVASALIFGCPSWLPSVGRRYGDGPLGGPGAQGPPDCSPEGGIPSPLPHGGPKLLGGVNRFNSSARRQFRLGHRQWYCLTRLLAGVRGLGGQSVSRLADDPRASAPPPWASLLAASRERCSCGG